MENWLSTIEDWLPESEFLRRTVGTALGRTISVGIIGILGLLSGVVGLLSYIAWVPISSVAGYVVSFLRTGVVVPIWLLSIFVFSALAWIGFLTREYRKENNEKEPHEEEYTEDVIEDIRWQWSWEDGEPADFKPLCLDCGMEVDFNEKKVILDLGARTGEKTKASCPNCGMINEWMRRKYGVIGLAKREVERRVREDEWQEEQASPEP